MTSTPNGEPALHTFTSAAGRLLSYRLQGTGPLLVMLPGGPGLDPPTFFAGSQLPGVQQLVFCPRGTGDSTPPESPEGYRIAGYVEDLEALRRHLDIEQLTLYGSSHGASTALAYATVYPNRVTEMVLASGPARIDDTFMQAMEGARQRFRTAAPDGATRLAAADESAAHMRTATSENARRTFMRAMLDSYIARPGPVETAYLDNLSAAPMNFAAPAAMGQEMMAGLDLLRNAHRILAATLVLTGELDARVPSEHMQAIADTIPGARLVRYPTSGHLIHVEDPERWADTVSGFMGSR